jgi:hypothetical protein
MARVYRVLTAHEQASIEEQMNHDTRGWLLESFEVSQTINPWGQPLTLYVAVMSKEEFR